MEENRRSQVELLYRDLRILLDEVDRLREENKQLKGDKNHLLRKNSELMDKNEWLEHKMRGIIIT